MTARLTLRTAVAVAAVVAAAGLAVGLAAASDDHDLPAPTGMTATVDGTTAQLSWDAVSGAQAYHVRRDGAFFATTTDTALTTSAHAVGDSVDYDVQAVDFDAAQHSPASSAVTVAP